MADAAKVLVVGSVLGEITEFRDKVKALDDKYGPFAFICCVGDFFGPQEDSQVSDLLEGKIVIPKVTYIMSGMHALPPKVAEKYSQTGGELTTNVLLLGRSSVITTSQGIRIAVLGGVYDPNVYSKPKSALETQFTSIDVRKLLAHPSITSAPNTHHRPNSLAAAKAVAETSPTKIDILLTHVSPGAILNYPGGTAPESLGDVAPPLDDVVRAAMPRYHFISGSGQFWERNPFGWPGVAEDGRVTRFLSLGSFGGVPPVGKKPRWSYAFSIVPLTPLSPTLPMPPNVTPNPFLQETSPSIPQKRPLEEENAQFRWTNDGRGGDIKRRRRDDNTSVTGNQQRTCRACGSTEHLVKDCPDKAQPPDGYICRRCGEAGHFIRDCPTKDLTGDTGGRKPPPGYICRACGSELHMIEDCLVVQQGRRERETHRQGGPPKEIAPSECWFCLSNPNLAKHLLVSLGDECYLSLPKGQLPDTSSKDARIKELFPVPGGGHVLIIPISHHPTLLSLPAEEATATLAEVTKYKAALRQFYAKYDASPVFFEVAKRMVHGVHAQMQVIPIPNALADEAENAFNQAAQNLRLKLEEEGALQDANENYFQLELPNGKRLFHVMDEFSKFPLQFGRMALASLFGAVDRIDWKNCVESDEIERRQAEDFKRAFRAFDPFA